ncbi:capsule biosynthesis protein [Jannaschia ovalis]|uniref:Capsule biosynthesis protein n=1 Tax=Jannaschia ovalis TaxID=3038773 RepID=A0ABY8LJA7_9RHOB|nr:capsule biosynthesis protein [Jannaschia sp. GRR-S6-38]WGH80218.1 capsule biosynthesis protein [Jannaschia sp. GRR-S6-38]
MNKPVAPAPELRAAARPVPAPRPPVAPAARRGRHVLLALSFVALVLLPAALAGWYLFTRAADQYASRTAFSIRTEEARSAVALLGGIADLSGSGVSDADVLDDFIRSQRMVAEVDAAIDLRAIWSRPADDPVFGYPTPGTIEDLTDHWARMVRVSHDPATGLISIRALAFTPADATAITRAILARSGELVEALSDIAREDALRDARITLDDAVAQLKDARAAVTRFRNRNQLVDPTAESGSRTTLIGQLEQQLAAALIELDLLRERTRDGDPRIAQARLTVGVIEDRIAQERAKLGLGGATGDGAAFADVVGEYERLQVDREFAEQSYTAALAGLEVARAEARRQSRYLAAHIRPTTPESARHPQRILLLGLVALFAAMLWALGTLAIYALRDRR